MRDQVSAVILVVALAMIGGLTLGVWAATQVHHESAAEIAVDRYVGLD